MFVLFLDFKLLYFAIILLFYLREISVSFLSYMMIMYTLFYLSCLLSICCTFVKLYYLNLLFSSFFPQLNCQMFHSIKDNEFEVYDLTPLTHLTYCKRQLIRLGLIHLRDWGVLGGLLNRGACPRQRTCITGIEKALRNKSTKNNLITVSAYSMQRKQCPIARGQWILLLGQ